MRRARLLLVPVLVGVAALLYMAGRERGPRPDVLLVIVDTLRADALGVYSGDAQATVEIDRLAARSVVYGRASSPMPMTRPAIFSIFTGLYPREHGVRVNQDALPDEVRTLAELLEEAGYQTGAFTGVELLDRASGAAQGFATFRAPEGERHLRADAVVAEAERWLAETRADAPVFAWVHLFDPHQPYDPPEGFRASEDTRAWEWDSLRAVAAANGGDFPQDALDQVRAAYQGEVRFVDHWVGRLLDAYQQARGPADPMIVFTADHGECFENGVFFEHADCLYAGAVHVPLIIHYPGSEGTRRSDAAVSLMDVAPTIARTVGLELGSTSGVPLSGAWQRSRATLIETPALHRERPRRVRGFTSVALEPVRPARLAFDAVGLVDDEWKYVSAAGGPELYRVPQAESGETDVADAHPDLIERLQAQLDRELEAHPLVVLPQQEVEPQLRETLKALGYVE